MHTTLVLSETPPGFALASAVLVSVYRLGGSGRGGDSPRGFAVGPTRAIGRDDIIV